jgi:surface protein
MKSLREHLNESLLNEVSMELIGRAIDNAEGDQKNRITKLAKERLEQILADGEAKGGSTEKTSKKQVFKPKTRDELLMLVNELVEKRGTNADLNDIDTSLITDMSWLFYKLKFNGDISNWDVSNVNDMTGMFYGSKFNGDISKWNVSNVKDMSYMFSRSKFNGDISKWNISNIENMRFMFNRSTKFNGDISKWDVSKVENMRQMFKNSPLEGNEPEWYKEK